jgi:hypothetical protein
MTNKKFNREQKQRCLDVLEQLTQSGLRTQEFAQTQGMSYGQLRAWQSHAPRWRAQLTDATPVTPARRKPASQTRFIQVKVAGEHQPTPLAGPTNHANASPSVRIDCSQGARSVVLHWPLDAPLQCAQWLKAYLS